MAAFLATVLVGPLVALLAAWSAGAEAARRLALVGAAALAGAALVMVCGAVAATDVVPGGAALVLVGMYAALAVVCAGTTRALATAADPAPQDEAALGRGDAAGPGEVLDPTCAGAPSASAALTAREGEVLALLAAGLSNAGIAARLVLSERTVDAHLRSVFSKLDLPEGPQQNRRVHAALRWVGSTSRGGTTTG